MSKKLKNVKNYCFPELFGELPYRFLHHRWYICARFRPLKFEKYFLTKIDQNHIKVVRIDAELNFLFESDAQNSIFQLIRACMRAIFSSIYIYIYIYIYSPFLGP